MFIKAYNHNTVRGALMKAYSQNYKNFLHTTSKFYTDYNKLKNTKSPSREWTERLDKKALEINSNYGNTRIPPEVQRKHAPVMNTLATTGLAVLGAYALKWGIADGYRFDISKDELKILKTQAHYEEVKTVRKEVNYPGGFVGPYMQDVREVARAYQYNVNTSTITYTEKGEIPKSIGMGELESRVNLVGNLEPIFGYGIVILAFLSSIRQNIIRGKAIKGFEYVKDVAKKFANASEKQDEAAKPQ